MSNHCIELICLECGTVWCCRNCGYHEGPNKESINRFLTSKREWAQRHHPGENPVKFIKIVEDEVHCSKKNVAII